MNKLELTKSVINFVVGSGVSTIVARTIKNNVETTNVAEQVTVIAGSIAIGSLVADVTRKHTDAKLDEMAAWWRENITKSE